MSTTKWRQAGYPLTSACKGNVGNVDSKATLVGFVSTIMKATHYLFISIHTYL